MISSYIVDCNILTDDCPFYCCIFWGTCIYQFSHAEEFVQNIRGSLLTKDGLCKFLHRGDAPEPAEALLFWLLPAAWLNITATPKKGRKAEPETVTADSAVKKQEEFEAMKKKTRNMLFGLVAVIVAAVAGIAVYKAMH